MRRKIATVALVGTLGLAGGALLGPGIAGAAGAADTATGGRLGALKDALSGLVKDGTITQTQADKVATTLDAKLPHRGPGGPGRHGGARLSPETVAGILGITVDELRTATGSGKTLAQIAAGKGISKATLIDELVAAAEKQLAAEVTAGRLTKAQADARKATLRDRITERVDSTRPEHGPGGHHGPRPAGPDGDDDDATTAPAAPSSFEGAPQA